MQNCVKIGAELPNFPACGGWRLTLRPARPDVANRRGDKRGARAAAAAAAATTARAPWASERDDGEQLRTAAADGGGGGGWELREPPGGTRGNLPGRIALPAL